MKSIFALAPAIFAVAVLGASDAPAAEIPVTQASRIPACGGEPCDAVIRGSFAFFDRPLKPEDRASLLAHLRKL